MTEPPTPTDLELMAFADGELDEPRRAPVEAWLTEDPVARAKLATLRAVGDAIRASEARPDLSVTDAVMAKVGKRRPIPAPRAWSLGLGVSALAAAAAVALSFHAPVKDTPEASRSSSPPHEAQGAPKLEHNVEVWSVDFAQSGAVFYVPSGGASTETTTVVWLSDDEVDP